MINSLGGEQDNVVFMGRRSFRMEIAGGPRSSELAIPMRASGVPTEKIFEADRGREEWTRKATAAEALQPSRLRSNNGTSIIALCVTTFALGIALTLTFNGRVAPRRAPEAASVQPPQVAAPTPVQPIVVQTMPIAAPTDAEIMAGFAFTPPRRPLAKPAARPRPVRAARPAQSADAEDAKEAALADPFADPAPAAKPAAAKPAPARPAAARAWVDPFAE